jgi:hypothetical protein
MRNLTTYLVDACILLGALNGLASAILLCVPRTSRAYPVIATIATDIKTLWAALASIANRPGPPAGKDPS